MSYGSNPKQSTLYVVRDIASTDWFSLVSAQDALLLVEDGVYRHALQLPGQANKVFALETDAKARATSPTADLINHAEWVTLSLQFSQMVRL